MEHLRILAIDPGPIESGYVIISGTQAIINAEKQPNDEIYDKMRRIVLTHVIIEECICRKWAGREVSDAAFVAGRFYQASKMLGVPVQLITRSKVRWHICGSKDGNDSKIIDRLISRKCPGLYNQYVDKEISRQKLQNAAKKEFFKGFKSDIWQAYALAITFLENRGLYGI